LDSLNAQGRLCTALEELAIYEDELEPAQVESFITAIFDVGDALSETRTNGFEIPIQWRVSFLVQHALEKLEALEPRLSAFANALGNTTGLSMAIEVVTVLTAKPEGETTEMLLPEEGSAEIRLAALHKIEDAAASGAPADSPRLGRLLHFWRTWGNAEDSARFTKRITDSPEGTIKFLKSMELRSVRQQIGDYARTERYYFQRNDIEPLISMDNLNERVKSIVDENLDEVGRRVVTNFQKAMSRRSAGKPDDGPFVED
jgi:hypothetical protein